MWTDAIERALGALDHVARRFGREPALPAHLLIDSQGEDPVIFYMERKGYAIVAQRSSVGNLPGGNKEFTRFENSLGRSERREDRDSCQN